MIPTTNDGDLIEVVWHLGGAPVQYRAYQYRGELYARSDWHRQNNILPTNFALRHAVSVRVLSESN